MKKNERFIVMVLRRVLKYPSRFFYSLGSISFLCLGMVFFFGCSENSHDFLPLSQVGGYPIPPSQKTAKMEILEMEHERDLLTQQLQKDPSKGPKR